MAKNIVVSYTKTITPAVEAGEMTMEEGLAKLKEYGDALKKASNDFKVFGDESLINRLDSLRDKVAREYTSLVYKSFTN